jgi:hypothetical protein
MSAGAVFKLIANDGKADRMIMATKLLNQRIKDVMCARSRAGKADITPTLVDLERTHILYINAHFKPFAAIGYEYNKVRPQSGSPVCGAGVTFSIPQFGDFFHDMVAHLRYKKFSWGVQDTPLQIGLETNAGVVFPNNVAGTVPTTIAAQVSGTVTTKGTPYVFYSLVDISGNELVKGTIAGGSTTGTSKFRNLARYCEYPGNKAFKLVKFDVNGNPLDQYSANIPLMLEKFCVMPNKRIGYDRLVGQEVPLTGYGPVRTNAVTDANAVKTPAGISLSTGLFDGVQPSSFVNGAQPAITLNGSSSGSQLDFAREKKQFVNGPQTPKPEQPALDIWNKLRFWFNDDVRLSIASVSIPFGQRFISIDLEQAAEMIHEVSNLYLKKTEVVISATTTFVAGTPVVGPPPSLTLPYTNNVTYTTDVSTTYKEIKQLSGGRDVPLDIELMELFINNIFVNPEVHDIFIKRIGFSLIRVYREMTPKTNTPGQQDILLSQIKWPVEYMMIGLRPTWNNDAANQNKWRDWHRLTRMVDATVANTNTTLVQGSSYQLVGSSTSPGSSAPYGTLLTPNGNAASNDLIAAPLNPFGVSGSSFGQVTTTDMSDQYWIPVPTVDTMSVKSHGITIFDTFDAEFFNAYMPYHYGGTALSTPEDPGALFLNFCIFPRAYQPSAHLNISRARETYLSWSSSYVDSNTSADVMVVAVAINFLLLTDGSAVLRYST